MMGNIVAAPIFNGNKELIGYISVIFDPLTLINASVTAAIADKPYELIAMQLDGLMIYDSDPAQQWRNMFTDPAYANFTSLLRLGTKLWMHPLDMAPTPSISSDLLMWLRKNVTGQP